MHPFANLFATLRNRPFNFPTSVIWISWTARVFFTIEPPLSGVTATTLKQSNTSKGKFQEKNTVHGLEASVFRFNFLRIVFSKNWLTLLKWQFNCFFLLPVLRFLLLWLGCFWTTWITIWKTPYTASYSRFNPWKEKDIILYMSFERKWKQHFVLVSSAI